MSSAAKYTASELLAVMSSRLLKDGQIVESGSHQQLLARGKCYAHLHDIQFGTKAAVPTA